MDKFPLDQKLIFFRYFLCLQDMEQISNIGLQKFRGIAEDGNK